MVRELTQQWSYSFDVDTRTLLWIGFKQNRFQSNCVFYVLFIFNCCAEGICMEDHHEWDCHREPHQGQIQKQQRKTPSLISPFCRKSFLLSKIEEKLFPDFAWAPLSVSLVNRPVSLGISIPVSGEERYALWHHFPLDGVTKQRWTK